MAGRGHAPDNTCPRGCRTTLDPKLSEDSGALNLSVRARIPPPSLAASCADTTATHTAHAMQSCAAVMVLLECCATVHQARCDAKPQVSMGM